MSFQRARSDEQRRQRREAILAGAAELLREMPVASITLSELSRRVGLAKSNILRYFESREEVLLELLIRGAREWVGELDAAWAEQGIEGTPRERTDRFAAVFAQVAVRHPDLLDLVAAQAAVLERNVSTDAIMRFKRAALDVFGAMAAVILRAVPELGDDAPQVCSLAVTLAGALSVQAEQSATCEVAYAAAPELAVFRVDLAPALEAAVGTVVSGALARRAG